MGLPDRALGRTHAIHSQAIGSLFALFEELCEGAIAVDREARIVWINDKYRALLGLRQDEQVLGRPVEEIIPKSMMRQVIQTGRPIVLDIMEFNDQWFVVTRLPVKDEAGSVTGAVGFVVYDRLDYLKPLVSKFEALQRELSQTRQQLATQRRSKYTFSQFIGSSPAALEVKRMARRAAQLDATILLLGETGTGKELLAQAIHSASIRANKPFVGINVAAIPETLLEAEFFGVAPGAYTGADRRGRDGKFKLADGGTLFLDEVGDMPLHLQAKLLRALEEQEIEPLGSNKLLRVNVRVIAATSRDLARLVDEGRFRADLYFRLNVLPIKLPPLRERLSDLAPLCEVLLEQIAVRAGQPQCELGESALESLAAYDWPGNVRELRNVLERACMLTDRLSLLREDVQSHLPAQSLQRQQREARPPAVRPLADALAEVERGSICVALRATGGKKAPAAKLLGISRSRLYEKIASYGILSDIQT